MIKLRNLKVFEDFNEIHSICKMYGIENYRINVDGTVDVDGDVIIQYGKMLSIPLKFGRVSGNFYCTDNTLITLDGAPNYVGEDFACCGNKLTSLEGSPSYVGKNFACYENRLISLEGSPNYVGGIFNCSDNKLVSLKGAPKELIGNLFCDNNQLPKSIYDNQSDIKYILANQDDYGIWNKDNSFNTVRFDIMMKDKDI